MAATDITGALARTMQMLRTERGWSLDQLATRSGVSKGVLVALEQGRSNPNLATLARISDAFGVPVTRLVELTSEPEVRITGAREARVLWTARPAVRARSSGRRKRRGRRNCGAGRCSPARAGAAMRTPRPPGSWSGWNPGR